MKIAKALDHQSLEFIRRLKSLARTKLWSRCGGLSDADVQELAMREASQVIRSPKHWKHGFSVLENNYATAEVLKIMERFNNPVDVALFLADNSVWTISNEEEEEEGGWFLETPTTTEDWRWETDPKQASSWFMDEFPGSVVNRYRERLAATGSSYVDVYNAMQADGWFLSHHGKISETDEYDMYGCWNHLEEKLCIKFSTFPDLLRYVATEAPEIFSHEFEVSALVKAYRVSLLRSIRARHDSAADLLKFYCSQGPIRSSDLKDTLFFMLTERFDDNS